MCFDGASGYFELSRDLRVVTALHQQIGNLLLSWTQPNGLFFHVSSLQD